MSPIAKTPGTLLAHVNHMLNGRRLVLETDQDGIDRYRAA